MIELMMLPMIAGLTISLSTGPLGCFVIWRKMAYLGETIAHASLIGIVVGTLINQHLIGILSACLITATLIGLLQSKNLPMDTLLGIISHGALAIGLIAINTLSDRRINFQAVLMGDPLTIDASGLITLSAVCFLNLCFIVIFWRKLLMCAIDVDLAKVEGIKIKRLKFLLTFLLATTIATSIQHVGVLLISGLLVIPAATTRFLAKSPEAMTILAACLSIICFILGGIASFFFDFPLGASVVSVLTIAYLGTFLVHKLR